MALCGKYFSSSSHENDPILAPIFLVRNVSDSRIFITKNSLCRAGAIVLSIVNVRPALNLAQTMLLLLLLVLASHSCRNHPHRVPATQYTIAKPWISKKFVQSSNMSIVMELTHRRRLVKLIVYWEKAQLAIAQYRFGFQNFFLGMLTLKMNHMEYPNPK